MLVVVIMSRLCLNIFPALAILPSWNDKLWIWVNTTENITMSAGQGNENPSDAQKSMLRGKWEQYQRQLIYGWYVIRI